VGITTIVNSKNQQFEDIYDFLLVFQCCKYVSILYHFQDISQNLKTSYYCDYTQSMDSLSHQC